MFFFFKRKKDEEENSEDESWRELRSRAEKSADDASDLKTEVPRVGSLSRAARPGYAARTQSLRERTSSSATDANATRSSAAKTVATAAAPRPSAVAVSKPVQPLSGTAEKRISSIGLPVAQSTIRHDAKPAFSRNPDVVPSRERSQVNGGGEGQVSDMQYHRFASYLQEKSGIVLGERKQYLVSSRLNPLVAKFKLDSVDSLITQTIEGKNIRLTEEVLDAMTTNETLWFRDTYPYLALSNIILPELVMKGTGREIRIWSAACSSGQEPFSIAIVIQEMMSRMVHVDPSLVKIIGTDLSTEMLQRCREGLYDAHALSRGLSSERRAKFFKPTHNPNLMRIDPRISRMVEFRPLNLLGSFALMGRFDVIFCRNVLIYFNKEVKLQILKKFLMCLNPGGYLILGCTETVQGLSDEFEMIRCSPGIIYKKKK